MSKISRTALLTDIINNIYTNVTNIISGNILQDRLKNIADSCVNWLTDVDTDTTLAANSDLKVSSQKAVKTYVDTISATIPSITNVQNSAFLQAVASGTDTYTANMTPSVTSYVAGQLFELRNITANTITGITININGLGAKNVVTYKNGAITVGDFVGTVLVAYDGTNFRMIGGGGGAAVWGGITGTITDQTDLVTYRQRATPYYISASGTANAIGGGATPAITSYVEDQRFYVKLSASNTGATTINIDGLGVKDVTKNGTTALENGDLIAGQIIEIVYDGTRFQLIGTYRIAASTGEIASGINTVKYVTPSGLALSNQRNSHNYSATSGTDTYTATFTPTITSLTNGMLLEVLFGNANTSTTPTIDVDTLGATTIVKSDLTALSAGDIKAGSTHLLSYNGTNWQIIGMRTVATSTITSSSPNLTMVQIYANQNFI